MIIVHYNRINIPNFGEFYSNELSGNELNFTGSKKILFLGSVSINNTTPSLRSQKKER